LEEIGDLKYNTSLDIWQMGCILFEFAVGKRAFRTNFDTQKFREGRTTLDIDLDEYFSQDCKKRIRRYITWMLQIEGVRRPTASQLVSDFCGPHLQPNRSSTGNQAKIRHSFTPPVLLSSPPANANPPPVRFTTVSTASPAPLSTSDITSSFRALDISPPLTHSSVPTLVEGWSERDENARTLAGLGIYQSLEPDDNGLSVPDGVIPYKLDLAFFNKAPFIAIAEWQRGNISQNPSCYLPWLNISTNPYLYERIFVVLSQKFPSSPFSFLILTNWYAANGNYKSAMETGKKLQAFSRDALRGTLPRAADER
jgi:serine/threonine protein kinase